MYSFWLLCSSCRILNRDLLIKVVVTWYVLLSVQVMNAVLRFLMSLGTVACFLSNFGGAVSWATIVCLCYRNSLVQIDDRFSSTSWGLRAASSETGSERDSASLTETGRGKGNISTEARGSKNVFVKKSSQDMQRFKTDRRSEDEMSRGHAADVGMTERMGGKTYTA